MYNACYLLSYLTKICPMDCYIDWTDSQSSPLSFVNNMFSKLSLIVLSMLELVRFIIPLYNRDAGLIKWFQSITGYQSLKKLKIYDGNYIKYLQQNNLFMVYPVVWWCILSKKLLPVVSRNVASSKKYDQLCGRL